MCSSASVIDIGSWRDPTYIAAKTGVVGLGRALARGLAGDGIRVNVVCPGTTDTELFREGLRSNGWTEEQIARQVPLGRIGQPADIARAIRFLLSDEAAYITGANLVVDGGRTVGGGK
jgi:NAD(P)-dependent dehydrogenase (short-subunit alcohol dehydrogenase family)